MGRFPAASLSKRNPGCAAALFLTAACSLLAQAGRPLAFSVLEVSGTAGVAKPSSRVISSDGQWKSFLGAGITYTGPSIDFSRQTVVAIFAGQRPTGGHSVVVTKVVDDGRGATVHYRVAPPPPDAMVTQALTFPYILIRLERKVTEVRFQPPLPAAAGP